MVMGIKYRDKKLGRYRKGVKPIQSATDYRIINAKFPGICAMCSQPYHLDERVIFKPDKEPGRKVAHISCFMTRKQKNG